MKPILLVMLVLIAACLPGAAPVQAAIPAAQGDCHHAAPAPHHPPSPATALDQHGCIGCAVPAVEPQLPVTSPLPQACPASRCVGFVVGAMSGLDPPPPRFLA